MTHRIRKQIIDLTLDSRLDGYQIQHEMSRQYWDQVVPAMNTVFDKLDQGGLILELDRLEIDLGILEVSSITGNIWSVELPVMIEKRMLELLANSNASSKQKKTRNLKVFEQWIFYMQHGYVSWNAEPFTDDWLKTIVKALTENEDHIQLLRKLLVNNSKMARRIASGHTPSFVFTLLHLITEKPQELLIRVIDELFLVYQHVRQILNIKYPLTHKAFSQYCLAELVLNASPHDTPEKLMTHLITMFFKTYSYAKNLPDELSEQLEETRLAIQNEQATLKNKVEDIIKKTSEQEKEKKDEDRLDENGIFIENAGIVLLHPFIPTLFRRLNLIVETDFSDRKAHGQAMMLLYFLATGNLDVKEYALTIAKMLCNYPLEDPLDFETELTEEQLEEGDAMLIAAIQQWEKIQNTSLTALRESFLQRPGKLYTNNDKLYLHVESQSIDMLLDYLPWNMNIIKLPWMSRALHVHWR